MRRRNHRGGHRPSHDGGTLAVKILVAVLPELERQGGAPRATRQRPRAPAIRPAARRPPRESSPSSSISDGIFDPVQIDMPDGRVRAPHKAGRSQSLGWARRLRGPSAAMNPRASAVLPTPSGPDSVITSPGSRATRQRRASRRRFRLVVKDHRDAARDRQGHRRAFALVRFELDRSAVGLDELAGQRQAKAERRLAAHAGLGDPVEPVEHARQVARRDAGPIVADADHGLLLVAVRRAATIRPFRSV